MIAILGYETSRSFWRLVYPPERLLGMPDGVAPTLRCINSIVEFRQLWPSWLTQELLDLDDGKVHLLTFEKGNRRRSSKHIAHTWSALVPDGSLCDLGTGVFVCSPAFLFLQTAATHSLAHTIAYGDELCGMYAFDPYSERGMRKRRPLTNVAKLRSYVETARGCPGYRRAMAALGYLVDGSASPAETLAEMLICLPHRYGGYYLEVPELNVELRLSPAAARVAHKSICYPDMYWRQIAFDIEYHGKYDHSREDAFDSDRARVNALRLEGIEVIELTNKQVGDLVAFETIALRLAGLLGRRIDPAKLGATKQRVELRQLLFSWNQNGGRRTPPLVMPDTSKCDLPDDAGSNSSGCVSV